MKLWPKARWARAAVVGGVVLALLVVTDRVVAKVAEGVVAHQLASGIRCQTGASGTPSISASIGGFPFLTELIRGSFDSVRINAEDLQFTGVSDGDSAATSSTSGTVSLQALSIEARDVTTARGSRKGVIGALTASATLPYSVMPSSIDGHRLRYGATSSGLLTVSTTMRVSIIPVPVTVLAALQLQGNSVSIKPKEIQILGVRKSLSDLDGGLSAWLQGKTGSASSGSTSSSGSGQQTLPALPAGLSYSSVTVDDDGLTISMTGHNLDASQLETKTC